VRLTLERMIYEADISSFVELHKTGLHKPLTVLYEPYTSLTAHNGNDSQSSSTTTTKPQRPSIASTSSGSTSSTQDISSSARSVRSQGVTDSPRSGASETPVLSGAGKTQAIPSKDNHNSIITTKHNTSPTVRSLPSASTGRSNPDEAAQTLPKATPRQNIPPSPGLVGSGGEGRGTVEAVAAGAKPGKFEFTVKSPPLRAPGTNSKASTLPNNASEKTSSRL